MILIVGPYLILIENYADELVESFAKNFVAVPDIKDINERIVIAEQKNLFPNNIILIFI